MTPVLPPLPPRPEGLPASPRDLLTAEQQAALDADLARIHATLRPCWVRP